MVHFLVEMVQFFPKRSTFISQNTYPAENLAKGLMIDFAFFFIWHFQNLISGQLHGTV